VGVKGLLFVLGRTDDVINLAGRKLDPEMMEEAILSDHAILECAVVDVPGATGQELAVVIVTPAGGIDRASLVARCAKAVPGVTLRHVVRAPRLPRNQNGKIVRDAVRRAVEKALTEGGDVP
jgi:acyl-coenzyme A synthetase/AMP-(fatty) acid ligase